MSDYLGHLEFGNLASAAPYRLQDFSYGTDGVTLNISVMVEGTSADNLTTRCEALLAEIAQAGNIYVHYQQGVTSPLAYHVLSCSIPVFVDLTTWVGWQQVISWTMTVEAWPDGAFTTLYNAQAVSAPASVACAPLGTYGSPADITIDDASGNDMHSVWCALALNAVKDTMWKVYASALTWTTMTAVGATANAWSNDPRSTTSASNQTASLDTSQYPAGTYKLLYRVRQSAGTGYVMDSQNLEEVAVTKTTYHLLEGPDLQLPIADTAFGTASNLTFYARSDGTNTLYIDAFILLPLDLGWFAHHPDNGTTEIDQIDYGPTGCWQDGVANATNIKGSGGPLVPSVLAAHCPELIATASPTGSTWPSDWGQTDENVHVTADTSRIKVAAASHYAWYAATVLATPIVAPGQWYQFGITYDVDSYAAGAATVEAVWLDIDGNTVRADTLLSLTANSASTATTLYAKAPFNARRCYLRVGQNGTGNMTVYFSAASMKRCPLRLIVIAEDAGGTLSSNTHAVTLSYRYPARYGVAR